MKNKSKPLIIIIVILYCMFCTIALPACKLGESTTVNISVYNTTAATSLFFTGIVNEYFSGLDTYAYFSDNLSNTIDKFNREKLQSACVAAYVTVGQLNEVFSPTNKQCKVILIDNYNAEGQIEGVWIARTDWINASPNSYAKMVKALLNGMTYRADNSNMSYQEAQSSIEKGYNLKKDTDVMQYIAIYEADNNCAITDIFFNYTDADTFIESLEGFDEGAGEGYEKCKDAYVTAFGNEPTIEDMNRVFDFSVASDMDFDAVDSEGDGNNSMLKFVLIALFSVAGVVAVIAIFNTISSFVKETKGLKKIAKENNAKEQGD